MAEIALAFRHSLRMKKIIFALTISLLALCCPAQSIIADKASSSVFSLKNMIICVDPNDDELVQQAANLLQKDIEMAIGVKPSLSSTLPKGSCIVIGSISKSSLIKSVEKTGKLNFGLIKNKWEGYLIQS